MHFLNCTRETRFTVFLFFMGDLGGAQRGYTKNNRWIQKLAICRWKDPPPQKKDPSITLCLSKHQENKKYILYMSPPPGPTGLPLYISGGVTAVTYILFVCGFIQAKIYTTRFAIWSLLSRGFLPDAFSPLVSEAWGTHPLREQWKQTAQPCYIHLHRISSAATASQG